MARVGISGFGRISRTVMRAALGRDDIEFAGINWRNADIDYVAYLLKYDSTFGPFPATVEKYSEGIIVDGKIVAGAHGAGGEIGHANVKHDETDSCNCGNKGCLEQMASATGIVRLAKKALAASDQESALRAAGDKLSAKKVFDAYKAGDALAAEIVEEFGDYLGGALATFATVVDPDVILIGGGVSRAGQPLVDVVEKYYKKYAFTPCKETPIRLAELGNDAGIYGSAKLVVE